MLKEVKQHPQWFSLDSSSSLLLLNKCRTFFLSYKTWFQPKCVSKQSARIQNRNESRNGIISTVKEKEKACEEEKVFLKKLYKFMATRNSPIDRLPSLGFKQSKWQTQGSRGLACAAIPAQHTWALNRVSDRLRGQGVWRVQQFLHNTHGF